MPELAEAKPIELVWRDYAFLTCELAKFVVRQDWDMFFMLLDQRETMQKLINASDDKAFATSDRGRALLLAIQVDERAITQRLRLLTNQAQIQQRIVNAYDSFSAVPVGSYMNRGS
jgi:hypothetical protein